MMEEKKTRPRWLVPAVIAAVLIAAAAGVWFFMTRPAIPDPYAAACAALDGVPSLENPVSLSVLGQGEVDGTRFGVSGNLHLQADGDGLALALSDLTLADEDGSTDAEVYINKEIAALRLPGVLGEDWYGVDLTRDLAAQATEAAGEDLAEWYFGDEGLKEAQSAAEELRGALGEIHDLRFADEVEKLKGLLEYAPATVQQEGEGFVLSFDKIAESDVISSPVVLGLDREKRLISLEFGLAAGGWCLVDLGDPEEPSPRLELNWGEDGKNSLELAFTISAGQELTAPDYTDAFGLVAVLAAADGN